MYYQSYFVFCINPFLYEEAMFNQVEPQELETSLAQNQQFRRLRTEGEETINLTQRQTAKRILKKREDRSTCPAEEGEYTEEKRAYRKRRTWLQKNFTCEIETCHSKFSSKMAFQNHQRNKHQVTRKQSRPLLD